MRGLSLSRPSPKRDSSLADLAVFERRSVKLTMGPRRGLVALNGRPGHVQFYNVSTNCLEASAEVVRSNRDTSAKSWQAKRVKGEEGKGGGAASLGPVVEHVAFSSDGKRMVAVASKAHAGGASTSSSPSPSLSFWKHARGTDPYGSSGYTGSYAGARNTNTPTPNNNGGGGGSGGGGTVGHWAADTSVDNPHGLGVGGSVSALEYHPREDVAVTTAEDGGFKLWGLKRPDAAVDSIAAAANARGGGGGGGEGEGEEARVAPVHWACTLSV
ncbi:unnamed protein product, partial [Laminaria digitata]